MSIDDDRENDDVLDHESNGDSAIEMILALRSHRDLAAQYLWNRYFPQLVEVAGHMLKGAPKGMADEEDVAISVLRSLCEGGESGRFNDLKNRDELWWLLLALTRQKSIDYIRSELRQRRGRGATRQEIDLNPLSGNGKFTLEHLIGNIPSPDFLLQMSEEHQRLMNLLKKPDLKRIASMRLSGHNYREIAEQLGICSRSVRRKLGLIRAIWVKEVSANMPVDPSANTPIDPANSTE